MSYREKGQVVPRSAALTVTEAAEWSRKLEDREAARSGRSVSEARLTVARRLGAAPGTLQSLRKGRLKQIAAHVYEGLRALVIRELEHERVALEHELQVLTQTGAHPASNEISSVLAGIAEVRSALGQEPGE